MIDWIDKCGCLSNMLKDTSNFAAPILEHSCYKDLFVLVMEDHQSQMPSVAEYLGLPNF